MAVAFLDNSERQRGSSQSAIATASDFRNSPIRNSVQNHDVSGRKFSLGDRPQTYKLDDESPCSAKGRELIDRLVKLKYFVIVSDFDGTLARIGQNPEKTKALPGLIERLRKLQEFFPFAVITGRKASDMAPLFGSFKSDFIYGNHGAEGPGFEKQMADTQRVMSQFAGYISKNEIESRLLKLGGHVENKDLSFALHYRNEKNPANEKEAYALIHKELDKAKTQIDELVTEDGKKL